MTNQPQTPVIAAGPWRQIDEYSLSALPITMRFGSSMLAGGTGFAWRTPRQTYLITNWHNVTGVNPRTGRHLSDHAGEPERIEISAFAPNNFMERVPVTVPLVNADGKPNWLEHPSFGGRVDVVAIPLPLQDTYAVRTINALRSQSMRTMAGNDVFVLGFPFGLGSGSLPIWKRASVASEPQVDVDGLPMFYVDTASRSGMSGSPVIRREWTGYFDHKGELNFSGKWETKFIGVYSGRIGAEDELKAQLGIVWRREVVELIVDGNRGGSRELPADS